MCFMFITYKMKYSEPFGLYYMFMLMKIILKRTFIYFFGTMNYCICSRVYQVFYLFSFLYNSFLSMQTENYVRFELTGANGRPKAEECG